MPAPMQSLKSTLSLQNFKHLLMVYVAHTILKMILQYIRITDASEMIL